MNEKVAKKIGEAYAFARVLGQLSEGEPVLFKDLFSQDALNIKSATDMQIVDLDVVARVGGVVEIVHGKAGRTSKKITEMGEFYVGNDWDDSAEVLEWLSFFLGAAVIHWQLIGGCAKGLSDKDFEGVASRGTQYYAGLLELARVKAESIGFSRAQEY
jgi:hypothetical protein